MWCRRRRQESASFEAVAAGRARPGEPGKRLDVCRQGGRSRPPLAARPARTAGGGVARGRSDAERPVCQARRTFCKFRSAARWRPMTFDNCALSRAAARIAKASDKDAVIGRHGFGSSGRASPGREQTGRARRLPDADKARLGAQGPARPASYRWPARSLVSAALWQRAAPFLGKRLAFGKGCCGGAGCAAGGRGAAQGAGQRMQSP